MGPIREKGSFVAVDVDGKKYEIKIFANQVWYESTGPTGFRDGGEITLKTKSGNVVNHAGEGMYLIMVEDGENILVTSQDPNAPE